ncbi:MAG TPA: patatin-like phospholipase family protein [Limnochordales bacterium]
MLSGGGARGAYQVGALQATVERLGPAPFAVVSGASIGAVHGAVVAEGIESGDLPEALAALREAWLELDALIRPDWRGLLSALLRLVTCGPTPAVWRSVRSLLDHARAVRRLCRFIPPGRRMGDYRRVELLVTATDLNAARTVVFDRSTPEVRVLDAVLASSALPVAFPSQPIGSHWYVDGGVFDNAPLKPVIRRGVQDVLVVATMAGCGRSGLLPEPGPFADVVSVVRRLWPMMLDRLMYEDLREARRINELVAAIEQFPEPDAPLVRRLKAAIGYEEEGRRKRVVGLIEVCPDAELDPPGTFGFGDRQAVLAAMERGYQDARRAWSQR